MCGANPSTLDPFGFARHVTTTEIQELTAQSPWRKLTDLATGLCGRRQELLPERTEDHFWAVLGRPLSWTQELRCGPRRGEDDPYIQKTLAGRPMQGDPTETQKEVTKNGRFPSPLPIASQPMQILDFL